MKEFVKKLTKKDDIIIFFVIFCISIGIALNLSIVAMDETWNFQSFFGSKVRLDPGKRRGKIIIEYTSNDDLERILGLIK